MLTRCARRAMSGSPLVSEHIPEQLANINRGRLDDSKLRARLGDQTWNAFVAARETGERLGKDDASAVARGVREWAQDQGCIGYSHFFSPVRSGVTHGEKQETFLAKNFKTGELIVDLTGDELFQTETDGSSFPNGGLRNTHTAAAYMSWDTSSAPVVYGDTLLLPSAFVAWTGDALDHKTPLLRSNAAIDKQGMRVLRHLGDKKAKRVLSNVGWEQEFFVIDRDLYLARPDLMTTGRTLLGSQPARGQDQCLNYFAKTPVSVRDFLADVRAILWEMGVSIDCVHNEVAPAQHEFSPIFSLTSSAADDNALSMNVLLDVAKRHNLAVLFHEKPFADLNGSGKHNNWGLNTDSGSNLSVPGKTELANRSFMAFTAALLRAVDKHGDLLRIGVSTSGNDHRLGAQEAPPAVLTLSVGPAMEQCLKDAADGGPLTGIANTSKIVSVAGNVSNITASPEDRNRTAPLPWCGNRFEFRAVGSNQHIGFPLTVLNAAVADSLAHMADEADKGTDIDTVIRNTISESRGALFHGDGYDVDLITRTAKENGLFNLKTSPEAYAELTSEKNVGVFERTGVFREGEVHARRAVLEETFAQEIGVEAKCLTDILRTSVLPAAVSSVRETQGYLDADLGAGDSDYVRESREALKELVRTTDKLAKVTQDPKFMVDATYAQEVVKQAMLDARAPADALEERSDRRHWPLPSYTDMFYSHH